MIEAWLEYHYAFGDEIKGYLKGELKDYFKSIHRKGKFLMKAQAKVIPIHLNFFNMKSN